MSDRRTIIALVVFLLDVLVCGTWAYREAKSIIDAMAATGSGGIAGISMGLPAIVLSVAPPFITIWLALASGSTRLANRWRNAHLAATLAMAILPVVGNLRVMVVSMVVFTPVHVFFVVGALAIWIASPRTRPDPPREATS